MSNWCHSPRFVGGGASPLSHPDFLNSIFLPFFRSLWERWCPSCPENASLHRQRILGAIAGFAHPFVARSTTGPGHGARHGAPLRVGHAAVFWGLAPGASSGQPRLPGALDDLPLALPGTMSGCVSTAERVPRLLCSLFCPPRLLGSPNQTIN